jgi:hypothetical protein
MSLGTILIIILILVLIGVIPTWGHSRAWGYGPSGIVGLIFSWPEIREIGEIREIED